MCLCKALPGPGHLSHVSRNMLAGNGDTDCWAAQPLACHCRLLNPQLGGERHAEVAAAAAHVLATAVEVTAAAQLDADGDGDDAAARVEARLAALRQLFRAIAAEVPARAAMPLSHDTVLVLVCHLQPRCAPPSLIQLS